MPELLIDVCEDWLIRWI